MESWERDAGYTGRLVSLGGVLGRPGHGIEINQRSFNNGGTQQIVGSNPNRMWMIIQANYSNASAVTIKLALPLRGPDQTIQLAPGGTFQIDQNIPWTGPITTDGGVVGITEAQLSGT